MGEDRTASEHLIEMLNDVERPIEDRLSIFGSLLLLDAGCWSGQQESLKGFVLRVVRTVAEQFENWGARTGTLDHEDLASEVLVAMFEPGSTARRSVRGWIVAAAVQQVRKQVGE